MKCVDAAVVRNLPALRDARSWICGGIVGGESLEKRIRDTAFRLAGDQRGVERLRFGAVENDEVSALTAALAGAKENADDGGKSESVSCGSQVADSKNPQGEVSFFCTGAGDGLCFASGEVAGLAGAALVAGKAVGLAEGDAPGAGMLINFCCTALLATDCLE